MLSDASRPVVEATLPAVGANIGEIARRFYPHMFGAHPELLDGLFNRGNQARGEQQQSLAGSVASFATALLETPTAHAGEPAPAHRAQARVAGHPRRPVPDRARQPDVGDRRRPRRRRDPAGRGRVGRGLLADGERADQPGARPLQRPRRAPGDGVAAVAGGASKIRETADVVTFVVRRIDDRLVKTSLPGQYVTVKVLMPDGVHQPRQYSLTRADDGEHRHFSVKRVHQPGRAGRRGVHAAARHGRRRRSADPVAALRRRRPRRRGRPAVFSAPASASPRWPACSPTRRRRIPGSRSRCCTPTSTRLVRPAPAGGDGRARAAQRGAARLVREGRGHNEPLDGVYDG